MFLEIFMKPTNLHWISFQVIFDRVDPGIFSTRSENGFFFTRNSRCGIGWFLDTLLGDPERRKEYFDENSRFYVFDRNRNAFSSILLFYQSKDDFELHVHSVFISTNQNSPSGRMANESVISKHQFENQYKGQFVWKPRFIDRDLFIEELIFFGLGSLHKFSRTSYIGELNPIERQIPKKEMCSIW